MKRTVLTLAITAGLTCSAGMHMAYADGPDGVVVAQISNPGLSGLDTPTGGGAGFVPTDGVVGSGVIRAQVSNPDRGNGQPQALAAKTTTLLPTQANPSSDNEERSLDQLPSDTVSQDAPMAAPQTQPSSIASAVAEAPATLPAAGDKESPLLPIAWLGSAIALAGLYLSHRAASA